jgi:NADH:ubiquinone oxidoreductase subunit H
VNDLFARHPLLLVSLVKVVVLLFLLLTSLAYLVWFERKVAAHIQGRWGPYRTGPHGLLQPLADGVKFLMKEDSTPAGADRFVYFLAPFLTLTLAISTIALIPFGPTQIHPRRERRTIGHFRPHFRWCVRRGAGRLVVE